MTRWLLLLIPHLFLSLMRYPAAVVAVLVYSSDDRRFLVAMRWLETIDNDLSGDSGWKEEHLIGDDPLSTLNRIRWLWRNGMNSINYGRLGVEDLPFWRLSSGTVNRKFWRRPDGAWLLRCFIPLWIRDLELFFGWGILGPQRGRCKYVCSVRLRRRSG